MTIHVAVGQRSMPARGSIRIAPLVFRLRKIEVLAFDDSDPLGQLPAACQQQLRISQPRASGFRGQLIDIRLLRQDPTGPGALLRRGDETVGQAVDAVLELDRHGATLVAEAEKLKPERNAETEEVARRKRAKAPADELLTSLKHSAERVKALDAETRLLEDQLKDELLRFRIFLSRVARAAPQNRLVRTWGEPRRSDSPRSRTGSWANRWASSTCARRQADRLGLPDPARRGAKLVRALANFMLDLHTKEHGYEEVAPPYLVNRASAQGTGKLPKFGDELYTVTADDCTSSPRGKSRSPTCTETRSSTPRRCR